jgi:hypothetical protein
MKGFFELGVKFLGAIYDFVTNRSVVLNKEALLHRD